MKQRRAKKAGMELKRKRETPKQWSPPKYLYMIEHPIDEKNPGQVSSCLTELLGTTPKPVATYTLSETACMVVKVTQSVQKVDPKQVHGPTHK